MDPQIVCLGIGLLILIIVNIVMGSISAIFIKRFDMKRLAQGAGKAGIVILCFIATYFVGYINPDIVAVNINGLEMDVLTAIQIVVLAGYYFYAKQVIEKLAAMVNGKLYAEERMLDKPPDKDSWKMP